MAKQFTLGKNEKLKSRKLIEQLFREGKNFAVSPFRVYYIVNEQKEKSKGESLLQFGVGVSGKNFKKAVDRNRIKRLIREAWRLQKNELKEKLKTTDRQMNIFLIYTGKEIPGYKLVYEKVNFTLQKLIKAIDQK